MTDAKHEAPAEGAGERTLRDCLDACAGDHVSAWKMLTGATDADLSEARRLIEAERSETGIYEYLMTSKPFTFGKYVDRARSSAPEARDLVAIQRDQWVPCSPEWLKTHPNGCAEAPRVACNTWDGHSHYHPVNWPTAPSADKLRIAVEALEPFALIGSHYRTGGLRQDIENRAPGFMRMLDFRAFRRADQALAALKAEGAK